MRFREIFYSLVPGWLRGGEGEKVLYSLGLMQDVMAERYRLSYEARLPEYAPDDALAYIGRDRAIPRGLDEPSDAYAARLVRYLDDHSTQGGNFALLDQLYAYLQAPDCILRVVNTHGTWCERAADGTHTYHLAQYNWGWDSISAAHWSRFWVIIVPSAGDPIATYAAWPAHTTPATNTASLELLSGLMSIISDWKPAGTRCEWVVIDFDDVLDHTYAAMTSDWADWSKLDGTHKSRSRLTNARYFRGPR